MNSMDNYPLSVHLLLLDCCHLLETGDAMPAGGERVFAAGGTGSHQRNNITDPEAADSPDEEHVFELPFFFELRCNICQFGLDVSVCTVLDAGGHFVMAVLFFYRRVMKNDRPGL